MKLCKENGFDFNARIRLDEESIKALYPEFSLNADYQKIQQILFNLLLFNLFE